MVVVVVVGSFHEYTTMNPAVQRVLVPTGPGS